MIYAGGEGKDTDKELRARYRSKREFILFITNLVAGDITRNTRRNHALSPLHQVLIALRLYASGGFLQVIGDTFGVWISPPFPLPLTMCLELLRQNNPALSSGLCHTTNGQKLKTNFVFAEDFLALLEVWKELT